MAEIGEVLESGGRLPSSPLRGDARRTLAVTVYRAPTFACSIARSSRFPSLALLPSLFFSALPPLLSPSLSLPLLGDETLGKIFIPLTRWLRHYVANYRNPLRRLPRFPGNVCRSAKGVLSRLLLESAFGTSMDAGNVYRNLSIRQTNLRERKDGREESRKRKRLC